MGTDVHINLDPSSKKAMLRHVCRVQRLEQAKLKPKYSKSRDSFQQEIDRRKAILLQHGIEYPEGETNQQNLIDDLVNG